MSQMPASVGGSSAPATENQPTSSASTGEPASAPAPKGRSCVICRRRKVRCDKQLPCGNCRRAGIACTVPSNDRPPRWARRLERLANNSPTSDALASQVPDPAVDKVMDRLHGLENLVKELSAQLEVARAAGSSNAGGSSADGRSPASSAQAHDLEAQGTHSSSTGDINGVSKPFGRLVLQDSSQSRYVSSSFWSRIEDEIDGLKTDAQNLAGNASDSSEGEDSLGRPSLKSELTRSSAERHAFLFGHNLSTAPRDLREFHPLPSQVPFLLELFSDRVNAITHVVHEPSVSKILRDWRGSGMTVLAPSDEALLFSIYYAAVTSMEAADVMTNFGALKSDLALKYRVGLEHALARADFLNAPDMVLVQALAIFLLLARRHDSPRFIWMMTGLVIRMAQYLGLQRDGSHFPHLSPFEIEMRRRLWWTLCVLDVRSSEDQGTDVSIAPSSFDTKIPMNIDDADISPESKQMPPERRGVTDMSYSRINFGITITTKQIIALAGRTDVSRLGELDRIVADLYQRFEDEYLNYRSEDTAYWVATSVARLVMSKLTLIALLPSLSSSPGETVSEDIRTKLLIAAIQVAEYNHALCASQDPVCRQWRWVYQTHTHWHAVVYLMIETARRPWSPTMERAWVALHSCWLIPPPSPVAKNLRFWVPLHKLMTKARLHREAELTRLRQDPEAACLLESGDSSLTLPSSPPLLGDASDVNIYRQRWRQFVGLELGMPAPTPGILHASHIASPPESTHDRRSFERTGKSANGSANTAPGLAPGLAFDSSGMPSATQGSVLSTAPYTSGEVAMYPTPEVSQTLPSAQGVGVSFNTASVAAGHAGNVTGVNQNFVYQLWDTDPTAFGGQPGIDMNDGAGMDLDGEVDWFNLVQSARGMDWEAPLNTYGWS